MTDNNDTPVSDVEATDIIAAADVSNDEFTEITQSVRIEAPDGPMPLDAVIHDLMVAQNRIEQYRKASLNLHQAVKERRKEEEGMNSESAEVRVLSEVEDSAFEVYERLQYGDDNYDTTSQ